MEILGGTDFVIGLGRQVFVWTGCRGWRLNNRASIPGQGQCGKMGQ